jgi:hypothetical protein
MRIALLTNIVPPYRLPVYRDLATTPGWALRVMLCAEGETGFGRAHEGAFERGRRDLDVEVVRGWSFPRGVSACRRARPGKLGRWWIPTCRWAHWRRCAAFAQT